jgi:hypothetical protein
MVLGISKGSCGGCGEMGNCFEAVSFERACEDERIHSDAGERATQLRQAPPLGHLFAYLLASNFLVPMQVPATLRADA